MLRPTITIKPPALPAPVVKAEDAVAAEQRMLMEKAAALAAQRAQELKTTAALKRLVVVQGPVSQKPALPPAADGKTLSLVGLDASKEVIRNLEGFFGVEINDASQKKLLEAVRAGIAASADKDRKVELLGWWPEEGVMAVTVSPIAPKGG